MGFTEIEMQTIKSDLNDPAKAAEAQEKLLKVFCRDKMGNHIALNTEEGAKKIKGMIDSGESFLMYPELGEAPYKAHFDKNGVLKLSDKPLSFEETYKSLEPDGLKKPEEPGFFQKLFNSISVALHLGETAAIKNYKSAVKYYNDQRRTLLEKKDVFYSSDRDKENITEDLSSKPESAKRAAALRQNSIKFINNVREFITKNKTGDQISEADIAFLNQMKLLSNKVLSDVNPGFGDLENRNSESMELLANLNENGLAELQAQYKEAGSGLAQNVYGDLLNLYYNKHELGNHRPETHYEHTDLEVSQTLTKVIDANKAQPQKAEEKVERSSKDYFELNINKFKENCKKLTEEDPRQDLDEEFLEKIAAAADKVALKSAPNMQTLQSAQDNPLKMSTMLSKLSKQQLMVMREAVTNKNDPIDLADEIEKACFPNSANNELNHSIERMLYNTPKINDPVIG